MGRRPKRGNSVRRQSPNARLEVSNEDLDGMFGVKIQSSRWDFCFILFAPGDESPGYCHGCPACAEASAGRPREGHQK